MTSSAGFLFASKCSRHLLIALEKVVEHLDNLGHSPLADLHPAGQLLVQLLLVPGGEGGQETGGGFTLSCCLQFVACFGVEALQQDSNVFVQLVPVPVDHVDHGVVLSLPLLQLVDPLPQLLLHPVLLVQPLPELPVLELESLEVELLEVGDAAQLQGLEDNLLGRRLKASCGRLFGHPF